MSEAGRSKRTPSNRRAVAVLQRVVVDLLIDVLVLLVLVALVWAVVGVARDVWHAVTQSSVEAFKSLTVEILTVFVFIELFHSLTEYIRYQRIRITTLIDASLAFVLREAWIGMYSGESDWRRLVAVALLITALGGVRTLAVVFSPRERGPEYTGPSEREAARP